MQKKILPLLLLLSMLLSVLAGCGSPEDSTPQGSDTTAPQNNAGNGGQSPSDPLPTDHISIAHNGKTQYQIVYPIKGGETMKGIAEALGATLSELGGADIPVYHDSETKGSEYEIRLGSVKHTMEAINAIKELGDFGENDFIITVRDNIIYIYAENTVSLKNAIAYFTEKAIYCDEAQKYVGIRQSFEQAYLENLIPVAVYTGNDENYLYFTTDAGTLNEAYARVSFTGNKAWRIQSKYKQSDEFNDIGASQRLSLFLNEAPLLDLGAMTVKEEADRVTATAPDGSSAVLTLDPFSLAFYTPAGDLSQSITKLTTTAGGSTLVGDILPEEGIFGTGERFDSVNQRGKKLHMFTKDLWSRADASYMVIPLLTFTRGSGVFLNIYEEMNLQLGSSRIYEADKWTAEAVGANMDCYIYTSDRMSDAIYGYSKLSGFAEKPEEWTYGMLICRYGPDLSQKWSVDIPLYNKDHGGRNLGVYDAIAKMEAYDLPWSGILAENWGIQYSWRKNDDLRELCDYVHSLGKKFLVYIRVGYVTPNYEGFEFDYLLTMTNPDGSISQNLPAASTNNPDAGGGGGEFPYLDITNPEAVEWFFGEYWAYLRDDIGVDGCKIDFCETVPEYYELNYYDQNQPTSGSHHFYPTAFCAMFFDMISQKPDSGMNFTRGGGIGSQRAPYMWAGDQKRVYESLQFQLTACLSSGMSGVPFMSYDMSGYQYGSGNNGYGTGKNDEPYQEGHVFVRGLQFTAFSICMQQHGKVRNAFEFADGVIKKEYRGGVWQYKTLGTDEDGNPIYDYLIAPGEMSYITDIYRAYLKLHEYLTPYINEYSEIACMTGMPLMRPLALGWQDDKNTYSIQDEYMFGDAFLVAPVLDERYERNIYLPKGEWKDLLTGEIYTVGEEGMTLKSYKAELEQLPVFYNINTTSTIAEDLLPGIGEIIDHINAIDCSAFYEKTGKRP